MKNEKFDLYLNETISDYLGLDPFTGKSKVEKKQVKGLGFMDIFKPNKGKRE